MTRARVRAQQAAQPPAGARLVRGTVTATAPLMVQFAGGTAAVAGLPVPGQRYTVGDAVMVTVQEPAVGPVHPLAVTPAPDLTGYLTTAAFAQIPVLTNLDTAPDGFGVALSGATSNPLAATVFVETLSASISGTAWRFQRASHESNGTTRTRRFWQGAWSVWAAASTA